MIKQKWLNELTAVGATLPCGATVVEARSDRGGSGLVLVNFDRPPLKLDGSRTSVSDGWWFYPDGTSTYYFPRLTPAKPELTPISFDGFDPGSGVYVTRAFLREKLGNDDGLADRIADTLGLPREQLKPWQVAYNEWLEKDCDGKGEWESAIEWYTSIVNKAHADCEFCRSQILKRVYGGGR